MERDRRLTGSLRGQSVRPDFASRLEMSSRTLAHNAYSARPSRSHQKRSRPTRSGRPKRSSALSCRASASFLFQSAQPFLLLSRISPRSARADRRHPAACLLSPARHFECDNRCRCDADSDPTPASLRCSQTPCRARPAPASVPGGTTAPRRAFVASAQRACRSAGTTRASVYRCLRNRRQRA